MDDLKCRLGTYEVTMTTVTTANEIVVASQPGAVCPDVEALVQAAVSVLTNDMQIATHDQSQVVGGDGNTVQLLVNTCDNSNIQERLYMCTDCNLAFYGEQGEQEWQWHLRQHKPFKCDLCSEAFEQKESLKTHMRSHTMQMPYICDKCGSAYSLKTNLQQHMKSHDNTVFRCNDCNVTFRSPLGLEKHMKLHAGESVKVYECEQCSKTFTQQKNLVQHMKIHITGEKTYKCSECPASYSYKCHLTRHLMIHSGDKPYKCKFCGKSFNRNAHLIRHRKIHGGGEKEWKCEQCGFAFWEKSDLLRHIKSHEGNRPFHCEFCEQTFVWKRYLYKHLINNHRADDKHFCAECCKCFGTPEELNEHENAQHSDKKQLTHTCEICKEEFYFKYKLDEHMFIHTGRKAHACEKCPSKFVSRKELDRHIAEHAQEVSFHCNTCDKTFGSIDQLQKHVKLHTGHGRYPCEMCGAAFRWRSQLASHMVTHSSQFDFNCDLCQKPFKRKRDLTRHIKIYHETKPPYTCVECSQDFHSAFNLHKHKAEAHWKRQDDTEYEFPCSHCSGVFRVRSDRDRHEQKVHPPRPYVCDLCHKTFTMQKSLEKHFELKHEGLEMIEGENYSIREIAKPVHLENGDQRENEEMEIRDNDFDGLSVPSVVEETVEDNKEFIAMKYDAAQDSQLHTDEQIFMETESTIVSEVFSIPEASFQQNQPISEAITLAHLAQQPVEQKAVPFNVQESNNTMEAKPKQIIIRLEPDQAGKQQQDIHVEYSQRPSMPVKAQRVQTGVNLPQLSTIPKPRIIKIQQRPAQPGPQVISAQTGIATPRGIPTSLLGNTVTNVRANTFGGDLSGLPDTGANPEIKILPLLPEVVKESGSFQVSPQVGSSGTVVNQILAYTDALNLNAQLIADLATTDSSAIVTEPLSTSSAAPIIVVPKESGIPPAESSGS